MGQYNVTSNKLLSVHTDRIGSPFLVNDKAKTLQWKTSYQPYGQTLNTTGTATQNVRLPGQYADASFGNFHNGHRDYSPITASDPLLDRYRQADPIGLAGGGNPYRYAEANPVNYTDPDGLRCNKNGCWTSPEERQLLNNGNYLGYYRLACEGGDAYACSSQHIAADDNWQGGLANLWLSFNFAWDDYNKKQCKNHYSDFEEIRKDIANEYADYLPQTEADARPPSEQGIANFHWAEFDKFGLSKRTFGGTPFGGRTMGSHRVIGWCPNCTN